MASNRIGGVVLDDHDASPLIGATVVLSDEMGKQVMGVTTDAGGRFLMKEVEAGSYVLQCSYVGYESFTMTLTSFNKNIDLGGIRLKFSSALLDEVVVKGEKVVQKIDRQLVMPTEAQKKASTNGVSLLQHLQLSGLTINPMTKSIATNYGEAVQLRINGVQATHEEVVALRPEDVVRVEYHEQPGLRYGGAAAVIDYIVKRKESGGNVSADLTNGVSPLGFGNYHLSGKYHQGKSTFTALMQWSRRDLEWNRENEETFYYPVPSRVIQSEAKNLDDIKVDVLEILRRFAPLDDKEGYVVHNREVVVSPNRIKYDYITTSLNYNYTNGEKSMLNIAFRNHTEYIPHSFADRNTLLYQEDKVYEVKDREQSKTVIPSLDIYYQLNLKNDQHLYFDVVGTYLGSDYGRTYSMTEQGETPVEIISKTEGDKYSLIGEAIYERPLWGGKFTTGMKHNQATMDNVYQGDALTKVSMKTAETSLFTEYQLKVKKLNYTLGIGAMRTFYSQGDAKQEKYIFRPTLNLSYSLGKVFLRYNASLSGYAPSLSELSDVEQPMDAYQVRRGNPNLKSVTFFTNRFSASYRTKGISAEVSARYSYDDKPIMEETLYENGMFVRTYDNQKAFHRLNFQANLQLQPFKQYVSIKLNPYFNRYISRGNTYTHTHSNWGFRGSIIGMYKNWIAMLDMFASYHEFWGETINKSEAVHSVALGYNKGKWAIQGMVYNPFTKDYHQGVENVSKLAPNKQLAFSRDFCPMFMLNVSFNLNFGKQKSEANQRIRNSDTDAGILSGSK
ncbi:MAG: TonB-dependent receptor [Bacteroidaceae bacterium]|nr:TonB-dependent receptor [Bacteroidaceae bacterium]